MPLTSMRFRHCPNRFAYFISHQGFPDGFNTTRREGQSCLATESGRRHRQKEVKVVAGSGETNHLLHSMKHGLRAYNILAECNNL